MPRSGMLNLHEARTCERRRLIRLVIPVQTLYAVLVPSVKATLCWLRFFGNLELYPRRLSSMGPASSRFSAFQRRAWVLSVAFAAVGSRSQEQCPSLFRGLNPDQMSRTPAGPSMATCSCIAMGPELFEGSHGCFAASVYAKDQGSRGLTGSKLFGRRPHMGFEAITNAINQTPS